MKENTVLYDKLTDCHLEILSCQYRDQVWNWYEYMAILSPVNDFDTRISHIQSLVSQIMSRAIWNGSVYQFMTLKMGFFKGFDEY